MCDDVNLNLFDLPPMKYPLICPCNVTTLTIMAFLHPKESGLSSSAISFDRIS